MGRQAGRSHPLRDDHLVAAKHEFVNGKLRLLREHHTSQSGKHWFVDKLSRGLLRSRGIKAATRHAEAFTCRKLSLALA